MPTELKKGMTCSLRVPVDESNVASRVGSGLADVFATPAMIAKMEEAAARCMEPALLENQVSVGTKVQVEHLAATPMGMEVTVTATITEVDRRRVDFAVTAADGAGEVGVGTHSRFVVDMDKFMAKAELRKAGMQEV